MRNKKILIVFIILMLIVLGFLGYYFYSTYFCYTDVVAVDNSFKVTVPNRVKYKVKESSDENYTLDFYSVKDEMFFYSNVINKQSEIDLKEVVSTEKNNLSSNLENVEITEETRFKEDLEVDSLDLFELVMAFEEEYGVEIPSEELESITTVGAVIKYMQDKGVNA